MTNSYTIGDITKLLNINKETIRYYEKIGLLSKPQKNESGYRMYSDKDVELIRFILIVKNYGFSLNEIATLLHDEIICGSIEDMKRIVQSKIDETNEKIKQLKETKKLLDKVKTTLLSQDLECCNDIEMF